MSEQENVRSFWDWFIANKHKYLFLRDVAEDAKEQLMSELLFKLHEFCDELYFEIGSHIDDHQLELVITADGNIDHFGKVEMLVDSAPSLEDWRFIKFRQPHEPGFITEFEGSKFNPDKIIYIPLENTHEPELLGIYVCYAEYTEEERNKYLSATYIMLDTLLGEKAAAESIDYLEVMSTPENIAQYQFGHLSDIGDYIKQKRKLTSREI
jgi:hypothetical protein